MPCSTTRPGTRASCSTRRTPTSPARTRPTTSLGLEASVNGALAAAEKQPGFSRADVIGLGVDTTGSTPIPVDAKSRPLALDPKWKGNLAAQAWLWKDHTGAEEAAAITRTAAEHAPQYLAPIGGTYSSEWFWSKIWHCLKEAPDVFAAAHSWVELADFVPAVLAGVDDPAKIQRCVCAAGHKAMYSDVWGGLPVEGLPEAPRPEAGRPARPALREGARGRPAGGRAVQEWAAKLGLREGIPIAMGAFDAHYGAVGSGVRAGTLVKIIGTSTCDCAVASGEGEGPGRARHLRDRERLDHARLLRDRGRPVGGRRHPEVVGRGRLPGRRALHARLSAEAAKLKPGQSGLVALDWNNGNRTILVDPLLTGLARRPDAPHDARRGLPRPHRGDGLRRPGHHRAHAGVRRADRPGRLLRRASRRRTRSSCRSTPT